MHYRNILAKFDELVARESIFYTCPQLTTLTDNGFEFQFAVSPILGAKPLAQELGLPDQPRDLPARFFGPGSDIGFDAEMLLETVNDTHLLVFNKFSVFRPQLLLLTADSYRRQTEPLDEADFAATLSVLQELSGSGESYYAFFNCGVASGSSRRHKHMQVVPTASRTLFPDVPTAEMAVPYGHLVGHISDVDKATTQASHAALVYASMLDQARTRWGLEENFPHNVVWTTSWIVVIPRRQVRFEGINVPNAAGMMGSVWVPEEGHVETWRRLGPRSVLAQSGYSEDL
ncbi:hypothetical protein B0I35DRAFT_99016 [Stachybotrys elegans]|uniref:Phosphorylase n=1 Tax=Stachybotrys elegans TaxID=80388 RepID=A0A8K0WN02_9HYPO|nr:hypothetical protein B0I35DRAFT_99016 [Stachybotrys elegans]